ncbi:MAG: cytochrome c [Phycisphaeraceae bacterium]|nr:cytochrome c [Phycisphaeraceae bacterium]
MAEHESNPKLSLRRRLAVALHLPAVPFWMISAGLIAVALSWIPLALIARARTSLSDKPRIQLMQDMGVQPRYGPQAGSAVFADGRAMRLPVAGTVARGRVEDDDHFDRGYALAADPQTGATEVVYFQGLPARLTADRPGVERLLARGQTLYNIYCAPCHGVDGYGHGPVNERALELEEPTWVPAASLHTEQTRGRADGYLYNAIRNGVRTMPSYGSQIETADRWAIVAYLRALQKSQHAGMDDVPPQARETLR